MPNEPEISFLSLALLPTDTRLEEVFLTMERAGCLEAIYDVHPVIPANAGILRVDPGSSPG